MNPSMTHLKYHKMELLTKGRTILEDISDWCPEFRKLLNKECIPYTPIPHKKEHSGLKRRTIVTSYIFMLGVIK
jgi:hypothetical protein